LDYLGEGLSSGVFSGGGDASGGKNGEEKLGLVFEFCFRKEEELSSSDGAALWVYGINLPRIQATACPVSTIVRSPARFLMR